MVCTEYRPKIGRAERITYSGPAGSGRVAASGFPDLLTAGQPWVEDLEPEDIRVLGEVATYGDGMGIRVLTQLGDVVQLMVVVPKYGYRLSHGRRYVSGVLVREERYGEWSRLSDGTFYPLRQEMLLVTEAKIREDLEEKLNKGKISLTSLDLLENQTPTCWYEYKRAIKSMDQYAPGARRLELTIPTGIQVQETASNLYPLF